MNRADREKYYTPAAWNLFSNGNETGYYALDEALGYPYYDEYSYRDPKNDFPLDDYMRELLTKLAGPHGKTILKAYRIQKGLEKCSNDTLTEP